MTQLPFTAARCIALVCAASTWLHAHAADAAPDATPDAHRHGVAAQAESTWTAGEVRKIDKAQGKVTLRHGPIVNLDMPAMTMAFKVADPKLLGGLKEGDKVNFSAERVNGAITVTAIAPSSN